MLRHRSRPSARRSLPVALAATLVALASAGSAAAAQTAPAAGGAATSPGGGAAAATTPEPGRYLVRYHDRGDAPGAADRLTPAGADVVEVLPTDDPIAVVELTADEAAAMARDPRVASVEPDLPLYLTDVQTDPTWGLDRIDQSGLPLDGRYQYDNTGAGVTVFVVDSGIRADHSDLAGRVAAGWTAVSDGVGTGDCNGHGTHVAATAVGTRYGVAKGATVVPVRIFGCSGSASTSTLLTALQWILDHRPLGPAVVNLSMGGPANSAVDRAVTDLADAGIPVVVSAGNDGVDACSVSPARAPVAITVGATSSADQRASFSNHGACVDLFAPGSGIVSASNADTTSTRTMSGTSMAAPHVTGAVARLLQAYPTASPSQLAAGLSDSSSIGVVGDARTGSPNRLLRSQSNATLPEQAPGYWMLQRDGVLHAWGSAHRWDQAGGPVVALDAAPGGGLWMLRADGGVEARGSARDFGGVTLEPGESAAAISGLADGSGYWIFTDRGRVHPRGLAGFKGDLSGFPLNRPIIASIATPTGQGYYLIASDGGVFAFGDAAFRGSMGGTALNQPVVGVAPSPDGQGYWLIGADGGIFAFSAPFRGSVPQVLPSGQRLNRPVIGGLAYGDGYAMVASDGGAFVFSDAPFLGSLGATPPPQPIVGLTIAR